MIRGAYVVRSSRSWTRLAVTLVSLAAIVAAGYGLYQTRDETRRADLATAHAERDQLRVLSRHLREDNIRLKAALASHVRAAAADAEVFRQVREALRRQQAEVVDLREELAFYQGIAIASDDGRDFAIRSFRVSPALAGSSTYRFRLVLTRVARDDRFTRGRVSLMVRGAHHGSASELDWGQLSAGDTTGQFQFRYFHRFEGRLELPAGFESREVLIQVTADEDGEPPVSIERAFAWPQPEG